MLDFCAMRSMRDGVEMCVCTSAESLDQWFVSKVNVTTPIALSSVGKIYHRDARATSVHNPDPS